MSNQRSYGNRYVTVLAFCRRLPPISHLPIAGWKEIRPENTRAYRSQMVRCQNHLKTTPWRILFDDGQSNQSERHKARHEVHGLGCIGNLDHPQHEA